jgi:histidyl-tRNA synthetase
MLADAECLVVAYQIFNSLGLEVFLEVNNRKLLSGILIAAGVQEDLLKTTILSIDKMKKIGKQGVKEELDDKGINSALSDKIFSFFEYEGPYLEILQQLEPRVNNDLGKEGIQELRELYHYLELFGIETDVKLLYSLARGLEIYTGTVFEAFLKNPEILDSSLCGGGRYDEIIGKFISKEDIIPAVGISFGLETIFDALIGTKQRFSAFTQVIVIPVGAIDEAVKLTTELRNSEIPTEVDLMKRKLSRNLDYANKQKIPYVIILGKKNLAQNSVTLRSMNDGKEEEVARKDIVNRLKHKLNE